MGDDNAREIVETAIEAAELATEKHGCRCVTCLFLLALGEAKGKVRPGLFPDRKRKKPTPPAAEGKA